MLFEYRTVMPERCMAIDTLHQSGDGELVGAHGQAAGLSPEPRP
ncbi:hypothetical protein [Streptomyces sp. NPDC048473]